MDIRLIITFAIAVITVLSAAIVAFSKNIVHSAFALLFVFAGVFGLYILLSADFVAIVQLVVYIGGILILILFAVMLTTRIGDIKVTNQAMNPFAAFILVMLLGMVILKTVRPGQFGLNPSETFGATTASIGDALLGEYLLPFELVSLLIVLVMVGALALARREVKKT